MALQTEDTRAPYDVQAPPSLCLNPKGWASMRCHHGTTITVPLRCNRCKTCLSRRAWKHARRIALGVEQSTGARKIELTSRPGTTWPQIMRAWSSMVRWIRRTSPGAQYACIKQEGPDNGMKHLHVMLLNDAYIPQRLISREWRRLTGAYITWVLLVESVEVADYVVRDLTRAPIFGLRLCTYSAAFPKLPDMPKLEYLGKGAYIPDSVTFAGVTPGGVLVEHIASGCDCWGVLDDLTPGEELWLRSPSAHSPPQSRAA